MEHAAETFQWPVVIESRACVLIGSRVFEPVLVERRKANLEAWADERNWRFGFYFGKSDTRLWVPCRNEAGDLRIINFGHPLGRKAFRILLLGYGIAAVTVVLVTAAIVGVRW